MNEILTEENSALSLIALIRNLGKVVGEIWCFGLIFSPDL